jgi:hypothetical protein
VIGNFEEEQTGVMPLPVLEGLLQEPSECTQVIPRPVLSGLLEACKPAPFVITIRSPTKPSVTVSLSTPIADQPRRVARTWSSRLATVAATCVITCGCALVVGMLVS